MSLEAAIADLTTELKRNSDLLAKSLAGRAEILEKAEKLVKGKGTESKAEAQSEKPAAKPGKTKAVTPEDVRKAFGNYMSVEDKAERAERKAFVVAMLAYLKVDNSTSIPEDKRAKAIGWLNDPESAPFEVTPEEDEDDEDERPAKKATSKSKSRDEDEEDEDEEDERPAKKASSKSKARDEEEDEDDEDERPRKKAKSRRDEEDEDDED